MSFCANPLMVIQPIFFFIFKFTTAYEKMQLLLCLAEMTINIVNGGRAVVMLFMPILLITPG